MVYGGGTLLPVEIETPSRRQTHFKEEVSEIGLKCMVDLIDELQEAAHVREFTAKHRAARK